MPRLVGPRAFRSLAIALLIVVPVASAAGADEDPETLIRQGVALRRSGDDAKAFGYFNRAYEISRTPRAAAQLGLDEAVLGRNADAQRHLSEALDGDDAWVDQNRALLERTRETVRAHLGKIELHGLPADATYGLPSGATERVPVDGVVWVEPGKVALKLAAPRHAAVTKDAVLTAGGSVGIDVSLPAEAAESATPGTPAAAVPEAKEVGNAPASGSGPTQSIDAGSGSAMRIGGLITAGAGVAGGVAGLILYLDGRSKLNGIEGDAMATPPRPYNPSNGNYQTLGNTGLGMLIGGVIAAGAGATLYLFGRPGESTGGGAQVAVGYVPGLGGNLQIGGRF
jgi:hypothetical protein